MGLNAMWPVNGRIITVKERQNKREWSLMVDNATGKQCIIAVPENRLDGQLTVNGKIIHHSHDAIDQNKYITSAAIKCPGFKLFNLNVKHLVLKLTM
jgi:hypothetical protein